MSVHDREIVVCRHSIFLKRALLAFWAAWLSVVFATNLFDAGKAVGLLGESWALASGNYQIVAEATSRYGTPVWLNASLFLIVILWEGIAALLFWRAWWKYRGGGWRGTSALYAAFIVGLTLWAAFLIAAEMCIAYSFEGTFLRLFIAQLATLIVIELLPEAG
jgi:hypothetical protein